MAGFERHRSLQIIYATRQVRNWSAADDDALSD